MDHLGAVMENRDSAQAVSLRIFAQKNHVAFSMDFLWVFVMGLNLFLPWFLCAQNTAKRAP